ncbi:TPA: hypothetical protein G9F27_003379 [Salmonella enterica]|uniref:Uncharacterized protein n=1 Tax=Salmonella enterica TaxID=28901 RepID=A0A743P1E6_SALER|nr:hypothetical protein [Salmonella enterica]
MINYEYALAVLSSLPMERALAVLGKLSKAFKTTEKVVSPEIVIKNPSSKLPSNTKSQSSSDVWKPNDSKINAGEYQVSNGSPNTIDKGNLANPIIQSRINVQNGDSKAGWEHVIKRHFSGNSNASQFTISESELKSLLQNPEVVKIPISKTQMSLNKATGKEEILSDIPHLFQE